METLTATQQKIAIQGYAGSYHEAAAKKFFGTDISFEMCDSFPTLFKAMSAGKVSKAVVAIENTVAGTILPNYALLRDSAVDIVGEVYLRIAHCLMCLPGQAISDIQTVHSHPMALLQCHDFFNKHPHLKLVEADDTAGAAAHLQLGQAAVASAQAAELQQLDILATKIEDNPQNFTRFLIIQNKTETPSPALVNKASLCFNLKHAVGSLAQVLLVLSSHGLNLTKIQSLPLPGQSWEYFFHIDIEFDDFAQYQRGTKAIDHLVEAYQVLGTYQSGTH